MKHYAAHAVLFGSEFKLCPNPMRPMPFNDASIRSHRARGIRVQKAVQRSHFEGGQILRVRHGSGRRHTHLQYKGCQYGSSSGLCQCVKELVARPSQYTIYLRSFLDFRWPRRCAASCRDGLPVGADLHAALGRWLLQLRDACATGVGRRTLAVVRTCVCVCFCDRSNS